jgi:hypothetical protein
MFAAIAMAASSISVVSSSLCLKRYSPRLIKVDPKKLHPNNSERKQQMVVELLENKNSEFMEEANQKLIDPEKN